MVYNKKYATAPENFEQNALENLPRVLFSPEAFGITSLQP